MKIKNIPQHNLTAAIALLSPYCPDLSPTALVEALREHEPNKCRDIPRYLNKHEAAQIFGVSWFTVVKWAKQGKIPAQKIGGNGVSELTTWRGWPMIEQELDRICKRQTARCLEKMQEKGLLDDAIEAEIKRLMRFTIGDKKSQLHEQYGSANYE